MPNKGKNPPHFVLEWRTYRDLTQEQFAGRVGMQRAAISKIEKGEKPLMQNRLQAFADAFDIKIPQLFEPPPTAAEGKFDMLIRRLAAAKLGQKQQAQLVNVVSALLDEDIEPKAKTKTG